MILFIGIAMFIMMIGIFSDAIVDIINAIKGKK